MRTCFLHISSGGSILLPADVARRLTGNGEHAEIGLVEHDDGRLELKPLPVASPDQPLIAADWLAREREADADIAAGRTTVVDGLTGLTELFAADDAVGINGQT